MDRYDFQEKISELLDKALNELNNTDFELLLSRVEGIISNYE